jgi:hypothetical protein
MTHLDFSSVTDDQLVELIRAALVEAVRRGGAVEAAVRQAGLDEAEKARIAQAAAERESRRIREEEERRIAAEAAERVRREAARKQETGAEEAKRKHNESIRLVAVRARELFGSDASEFMVQVWEKPGDRRVYIGHGYESNWLEYYRDGTSRYAPGTLMVVKPSTCPIFKDLAAHLGKTVPEAVDLVKEFCEQLCKEWKTVKIEVNTSNAPLHPGSLVDRWILHAGDNKWGRDHRKGWLTFDKSEATTFESESLALEAIPKYVGANSMHLAKTAEEVTVVKVSRRLAFPPTKEASV